MRRFVLLAAITTAMPCAASAQRTQKPPATAVMIDRKHGTFRGAAGNRGEDHGIGW